MFWGSSMLWRPIPWPSQTHSPCSVVGPSCLSSALGDLRTVWVWMLGVPKPGILAGGPDPRSVFLFWVRKMEKSGFSDLRFSMGPEKGLMGTLPTQSWHLGETLIRDWCRVKPSLASPTQPPRQAESWSLELQLVQQRPLCPFTSWDLCIPKPTGTGPSEGRPEPMGDIQLWMQPGAPQPTWVMSTPTVWRWAECA